MSAAERAFEQAFWQALDDIKEGTAKPIESYLGLVSRDQRDELGRMLADVLQARGPVPMPSREESEGYARAVATVDEVLGKAGPAGILPGALRKMRHARGIEPEQVVARLASDFQIEGEGGRTALARNYHRLETGKLLGSRLTAGLLESLARVFEIDVRDLLAAAKPAGKAPGLSGLATMGRGGSSPATASRTEPDLLPDPEVERVERLFHGGPNA